jgi:hypothetical protein
MAKITRHSSDKAPCSANETHSVHKPVSKAGVAAGSGSMSTDSHGGQHIHPKIDPSEGLLRFQLAALRV